MKNQIENIRYLASRELQERYIVKGTKGEYLLPEELIADAMTFVEDVETGIRGKALTDRQRNAIQEFGKVLRANVNLDYAATSNENLIQNDPRWSLIRQSAQLLLMELDRA